MEIYRYSACLFIIVVCMMGIPTHAQTGTATTTTTLATETTPAGTENTGGSTLAGVTSDATMTTGVTTAGPTGTPGTPTTETAPGDTTPAGTENTGGSTLAGVTSDASMTTEVTTAGPRPWIRPCAGPTGTPGTTTSEKAPGEATGTASASTTVAVTSAPATTGTDAPTETPGTDASPKDPGTDATTEKPRPDEPTEKPGTGEPTEKPGTGEPIEKPGTGEPTEKPGTKPPPKMFEGNMRITDIDSLPANFTDDLTNTSSDAFKDLSEKVCAAVTAVANESSSLPTPEDCEVTEFSSGSVIAIYRVVFPAETTLTADQLVEHMVVAFTSSTNPLITQLGVDTSSITAEEILPLTQAPDLTTVTPTDGQPVPVGLSPGAIAGIVVGAVLLVLIVMVIIVFVVMKMKGNDAKVASQDNNPQPPSNHEYIHSPGSRTQKLLVKELSVTKGQLRRNLTMEFYRSSVCLFIIVVCMMGIPTNAQTGTAATETTEYTGVSTLAGVTSDTTITTEVMTVGPTGTPTMETGTASSTTVAVTSAPATTGTDAPTETPGMDASTEKSGTDGPTEKPGTSVPTEKSGTGEPTEKSGTGEPTEKSGTGEPTEKSGTGEPTEKSGTGEPTEKSGTGEPTEKSGTGEPTEKSGTGEPTEKSGTGEPTEKSGTGEPTEKSGTGEPTDKSGTGEPTEKPGTKVPTEKPGTKAPTEKPGTKPPGKEFAGDLPITQIDGTDAVFGGDYEKPDSKPYKDLSVQVCTAVTAAMENSTAGSSIEGCSVSGFRSGSIVATFLLEFPADTKVTPEEVTTTLKDAFKNSTDPRIAFLTVDTSSISVKEVIPSTLPPEPGLSPGAIAGIVVGSVAAVAIIVVIIVVLVMKNKGSAKVQDVEEQELTRPSSRGKSPPPDRVSNASDKSS
ncbi:mucin-2-like [Patiria miniata]|uniref:SEA domain-containing protein n=1 Tax=Patiria miniata TaxID=46514 RepID=A0A914A5A0_PATMI|nr:mucin-2-like [Patiria miniata]